MAEPVVLKISVDAKSGQIVVQNFENSVKRAMTGVENATRNATVMMSSSFRGMQTAAQSVGVWLNRIALGGVAALGFGLRSVLSIGSDFQYQMQRVANIAGVASDGFDRLSAKAREVGENTAYTAAEIAQAMQYLASMGLSIEQIIGAIEPVVSLAGAMGGQVETAAEMMAVAYKQFGLSVEDSWHIVDVLATTIQKSLFPSLEEMSEAFFEGAVAANTFGWNIEELSTLLAAFRATGRHGARVGHDLYYVFTYLARDVPKLHQALGKLNMTMADIEPTTKRPIEILKEFAKRGLEVAEAAHIAGFAYGGLLTSITRMISKGRLDLDSFYERLKYHPTSVKELYGEMMTTIQGYWVQVKSVLEETALVLFDAFKKPLGEGLKWLATFFKEINAQLRSGEMQAKIELMVENIVDKIKTILETVKSWWNTVVGVFKWALIFKGLAAGWAILKGIGSTIVFIASAFKLLQAGEYAAMFMAIGQSVEQAAVSVGILEAAIAALPAVVTISFVIAGALLAKEMRDPTWFGQYAEAQEEMLAARKNALEVEAKSEAIIYDSMYKGAENLWDKYTDLGRKIRGSKIFDIQFGEKMGVDEFGKELNALVSEYADAKDLITEMEKRESVIRERGAEYARGERDAIKALNMAKEEGTSWEIKEAEATVQMWRQKQIAQKAALDMTESLRANAQQNLSLVDQAILKLPADARGAFVGTANVVTESFEAIPQAIKPVFETITKTLEKAVGDGLKRLMETGGNTANFAESLGVTIGTALQAGMLAGMTAKGGSMAPERLSTQIEALINDSLQHTIQFGVDVYMVDQEKFQAGLDSIVASINKMAPGFAKAKEQMELVASSTAPLRLRQAFIESINKIPETMRSALQAGFSEYLATGNLENFTQTVYVELKKAVYNALIEGFVNQVLMTNVFQPLLDRINAMWTAQAGALKGGAFQLPQIDTLGMQQEIERSKEVFKQLTPVIEFWGNIVKQVVPDFEGFAMQTKEATPEVDKFGNALAQNTQKIEQSTMQQDETLRVFSGARELWQSREEAAADVYGWGAMVYRNSVEAQEEYTDSTYEAARGNYEMGDSADYMRGKSDPAADSIEGLGDAAEKAKSDLAKSGGGVEGSSGFSGMPVLSKSGYPGGSADWAAYAKMMHDQFNMILDEDLHRMWTDHEAMGNQLAGHLSAISSQSAAKSAEDQISAEQKVADERKRLEEEIAATRKSLLQSSLGAGFESIMSGEGGTKYKYNVMKGTYDAVVDGLMNAFMESAIYQQMMEPLRAALAGVTFGAGGATNLDAVRAAIANVMSTANSLAPMFQSIFAMFSGVFNEMKGMEAMANVSAEQGNWGSFQTGTEYVPKTGLYRLHQGEQVIAANEAPASAQGPITVIVQANAPQDWNKVVKDDIVPALAYAQKRGWRN